MNLDDYLSTASVMDCNGQTSYKMTLLLNGNVSVVDRAGTFEVNPHTREVFPSGRVVLPEILDQVVAFGLPAF
jgi:hypothetical protein